MRTQHPKARLDARTKQNWISCYYDETGKRKYVTLGSKNDLKKADAQIKLDAIVQPINQIRAARNISALSTLAEYVAGTYLEHGRRKWKASTAGTTWQRIKSHIVGGELAGLKLSEINRLNMQAFLDAREMGHSRW